MKSWNKANNQFHPTALPPLRAVRAAGELRR